MSALKKISGYKGVAQMIEAGKIQFFIVANNARDLETVYHSILEDAEEFNPETLSKVVIISAADLPEVQSGKFIVTQSEEPTTNEQK